VQECGGPFTPQELRERYGLDEVALSTRRRCVLDPLYLASEVCSALWQANLMRTPSSAHREVAQTRVRQQSVLYVDARGTAKTTLLDEVGGAYQLLCWPDDSLLFLQSSESNAKALLGQVRSHFVHNPVMRQLFPEYAMGPLEGSEHAFSVPCRRVRAREQSAEWGTPGTQLAGRHYDVVFSSDLMNENTTPPPVGRGTLESMVALVGWYAQTDGLLKGKEVNPRAHRCIDSNRWADGDLVGEVLRKEDAVGRRTFVRVLRGVVRGEDGEWVPTWPEVKTPQMLAEIHDGPTMTAATWAANFQSDPLPEGGASFLREWFHHYGTGARCPCGRLHERPARLEVGVTLDPAFADGESVKRRNSRSGLVASGVCPEGLLWVLDVQAGQWSPDETAERLTASWETWERVFPGTWAGVEKTGGSEGLLAVLRNRFARTGRHVPLRLMRPAGRAKGSPDRIGPLHATAEHFGIFVRPGLHDELVEELLRFGVARRNDLADALAMRAMDLYVPRGVRQETVTRPDNPRGLPTGEDVLRVLAARHRPRSQWERVLSGGRN
jgi:hypothetical protein